MTGSALVRSDESETLRGHRASDLIGGCRGRLAPLPREVGELDAQIDPLALLLGHAAPHAVRLARADRVVGALDAHLTPRTHGLGRAILVNIQNLGSGRRPVGASTITQQVAKNFLLTNDQTIDRKVKEAILAAEITRRYDKDTILQIYLNEIYYGNLAYGIEAAGRIYFGRSVSELSLAEAAMLAALPFAPATYNPAVNPESVRNRRKWVLLTMRDHGFISPEECLFASLMPVVPPVPPARIAPVPLLSHY